MRNRTWAIILTFCLPAAISHAQADAGAIPSFECAGEDHKVHPGGARPPGTNLRVVTWNIDHGFGKSNAREPERVDLVEAELRQLAPDAVVLQEVSVSAKRENRATLLGRRLDLNHHWQRSGGVPAVFAEGLAFLTRSSMGEIEREILPQPGFPGLAFRQVVGTTINVEELSHRVFIANTHFEARKGFHLVRLEQALSVLEFIATEAIAQNRVAILAGDFNAIPEDLALSALTGDLLGLPGGAIFDDPGRDLGATGGSGRIDYILVARGLAVPADISVAALNANKFQKKPPGDDKGHLWPSGHAAVLVDFRMEKRGTVAPAPTNDLVSRIHRAVERLRHEIRRARIDAEEELRRRRPEQDPDHAELRQKALDIFMLWVTCGSGASPRSSLPAIREIMVVS